MSHGTQWFAIANSATLPLRILLLYMWKLSSLPVESLLFCIWKFVYLPIEKSATLSMEIVYFTCGKSAMSANENMTTFLTEINLLYSLYLCTILYVII